MLNTNLGQYSDYHGADAIDSDRASDTHVDAFLANLVDFEDRGLRTCFSRSRPARDYGIYRTDLYAQ